MPQNTLDLAAEFSVSPRQVLNYKETVEKHVGQAITYRCGKRHYYHDRFIPLLRMVANGEPLPQTQEHVSITENPFRWEEPAHQIVLHTEKLAAPMPVSSVDFEISSVDTTAIDTVTEKNLTIVDQFKSAIESQVLGDARAFGAELGAKVRNVISKEVALAYREVIR